MTTSRPRRPSALGYGAVHGSLVGHVEIQHSQRQSFSPGQRLEGLAMFSVPPAQITHRREHVIASASESLRGGTTESCAGSCNEHAFRHRLSPVDQSKVRKRDRTHRIIGAAPRGVKSLLRRYSTREFGNSRRTGVAAALRDGHVSQDVDQLAARRAWRASAARDPSGPSCTASPVPKYHLVRRLSSKRRMRKHVVVFLHVERHQPAERRDAVERVEEEPGGIPNSRWTGMHNLLPCGTPSNSTRHTCIFMRSGGS